jgi:hypothetical protein
MYLRRLSWAPVQILWIVICEYAKRTRTGLDCV